MSELTRYHSYAFDTDGDEEESVPAESGDGDETPAAAASGGDSDEAPVTYEGDSDNASAVPEEPKRKKHRCCLATFITALVLVLVLCGGILGGAYFAWDRFLGEPTQMNLFQGLGVLSNIYKADDSVVTAPYSEKDLDDFYDRILDSLCMRVDRQYDLDLPAIVVDILNGSGAENADGSPDTAAALAALNGGVSPYAAQEEQSQAAENQTTGSNELDKLLQELKFDWAELEYPTDKTGDVDISGPQLAAFIDDVMRAAFAGADSLVQMQEEWHVDFAQAVSVSQVIVSASDEVNQADTKVSATIKICLRDAVKGVAQKFDGIAAFGIKAAALLLPKEIYFTAEVYPCAQDGRAGVVINSTSADDMEKMLRIVDAVLGLTGSEFNTGDFLTQINATVYNAVQSVNNLVNIRFVSDLINAKPIGALISAMGLQLTPLEFFQIVRYVAAPDHYMDRDEDGKVIGFEEEEYSSADLKQMLKEDFGLIIKGEEDKDDPEVPGVYIDDNNLYMSMKDIFSGTDAIIDNIAFGPVAEREPDSITPTVSYESLGALMRSYLKSDEATGVIHEYGFKLLSIGHPEVRESDSVYITAKFEFDMRATLRNKYPSLFDEGSLFYNLINQLLPSAVYLTADIEISAATSGEMNTDIVFNDAENNTEALLTSMCNLLVGLGGGENISEELGYDAVCNTLSQAITSVLAAKDEEGNPTGIGKFIAKIDEKGVHLENVYSLMYSVTYEDKLAEGTEAEDKVEKADFTDAVRNIYLLDKKEAKGQLTADNNGMDESAFLGSAYRPQQELSGFDFTGIFEGTGELKLYDVLLADIIISREHAVTQGGEGEAPGGEGETPGGEGETPGGEGENPGGETGEGETGGEAGEPEQDTRNNLAASLGLSADVEYGKDYWIEQLVMLGVNTGTGADAQQKSVEQEIFDSFKDKYNAWRTARGMQEKNAPDELLAITATLASSALAENNAAFKLLPQYFTVTIIMDLSMTEDDREALKDATINQVAGYTNDLGEEVPPEERFAALFSVAVFINDMSGENMETLGKVLAADPGSAGLADTVFGEDLNNKIRRFLLSFALHENATDEAAGTIDPIPDIGLYTVLACSDMERTDNVPQPVQPDPDAPAPDPETPVFDTQPRAGVGMFVIDVAELALAVRLDMGWT